ncbi:hypothetical protein H0H93_008966 [Arthromyces matolae]|nr:hypothetical protein H0H93_008966 [Arthromyces matolae]
MTFLQLVRTQPNCWPENIPFNTKTTKTTLANTLLDTSNGFTTTLPPDQPESTTQAQPAMGPVTQPAQAAVSFSSVNPSVKKKLELFICDHRRVPPSEEATELELQLYPAAVNGNEGWLVSGRELLVNLQQTFSPIRGQGLVRVGIPNQHVPQYTQFFVEAAADQLPTAVMNPEVIRIPPFNTSFPRITLKIYDGPSVIYLSLPLTDDDSSDGDDHICSIYLSEDEIAHVAGKLATAAESLPVFSNVKVNAGSRSLRNEEIVQIWEFRAAFWHHYHRQWCSEVTNASNIGYKRITGECICRALEVVHSTMMQAREGMRLVNRYARGPTAHQEVVTGSQFVTSLL